LEVEEMSGKLTKKEEKEIEKLIKQLKDEAENVRGGAAEALMAMGEKAEKAAPALIELLMDKILRFAAQRALTAMGEKAVPALIEALKDEVKNVRYGATVALAEMGEKAEKAVPALIEALKDEVENVRFAAAQALGRIGEKAEKAVPALIEALKDEVKMVRSSAARALGMIGEKAEKALPHLKEQLTKEKERNTKYSLAMVLTKIERKRGEGTRIIGVMKEKGELTLGQIREYDRLCQELDIKTEAKTLSDAVKQLSTEKPLEKAEKERLITSVQTIEDKLSLLYERAIDKELEREEAMPVEQLTKFMAIGKTRAETASTIEEIDYKKAQTELALLEAQSRKANAEAEKAEKMVNIELKRAELDIKRKNWQKFLIENSITLLNMMLTIFVGILVAILTFVKT